MMYNMPMSNKSQKYEINEKDIETVLGILQRTDPENATPQMAIALLEELQMNIHLAGHKDIEALIETHKRLKREKKLKTN